MRMALAVQFEDECRDQKKVLRLEQTTSAEWVQIEGWDVIADHLREDGLVAAHC